MFGKMLPNGELISAAQKHLHLTTTRKVYTQSHIDYVVEVYEHI
jgi:tryptophanase